MNKIYCSNCGELIPESSNFCKYCGAPQHGPQAAVYRAQAPVIGNSLGSFAISQSQKAPRQQVSKTTEDEAGYLSRRHLCGRVVWSFLISYFGTTSILVLLFAVGALLNPQIFVAAFIGYLFGLYIVALIVYNNFYFAINEEGFLKEYGVIHKRQVTIPFQQIQNVNITRSLTDRILGLAKVSIETAGSAALDKSVVAGGSKSNAEGHLPGLTLAQAKKVHDILLQKANVHGRQNHQK